MRALYLLVVISMVTLPSLARRPVSVEDDCDVVMCTMDYTPVCGSDGKTYGNGCLLNAASCKQKDLTQACRGECPCDGEDRELLRIQSVEEEEEEEEDALCDFMCTMDYQPVCGSDNKTRANNCELDAIICEDPSIKWKCNGKCPCKVDCDQLVCTADYSPVCGSDGETYSNRCSLLGRTCVNPNLKVKCARECPCTVGCPTLEQPDNMRVTIDGDIAKVVCDFTRERWYLICRENKWVGEMGNCTKEAACNLKVCNKISRPVCGSDGQTYTNQCMLEREACSSSALTQRCTGECPCLEDRIKSCKARFRCPNASTPVCGSDGVTYTNTCFMQAHRTCVNDTLTMDCARACPCACSFPCPDFYMPACSNHNVTYTNVCELVRANCMSGNINAQCVGECPCKPLVPPTTQSTLT